VERASRSRSCAIRHRWAWGRLGSGWDGREPPTLVGGEPALGCESPRLGSPCLVALAFRPEWVREAKTGGSCASRNPFPGLQARGVSEANYLSELGMIIAVTQLARFRSI
jgi:hypothetical protein